ncbi:SAP30L family protein [Megaselia abdita]
MALNLDYVNQLCCLIDSSERCKNPAGNASYSRRIQKTVSERKLKLSLNPDANHIYICDFHKARIQSARSKRKRKDSDDVDTDDEVQQHDVDLYQLQLQTLRRYKKHFKIPTRPNMNKAQLACSISKHFRTIPIREKEIITYFIYMVKSGLNKIDQPKNGYNSANNYE